MTRTARTTLSMEHALLGFLLRKPMHGYEIYREMCEPHGLWLIWRIKQSQLYALLGKLADEGMIRATLQTQAARPPRKVFHLTRRGRERFQAWLGAPVPHGRDLRQDFLAKLYFAMQDGPAAAAALIAGQRAACQSWLAAMQPPERDAPGELRFEHMVDRFRRSQIEATLDWLNACERTIARPRSAGRNIAARITKSR
jgi:PadR family transcriptional regulator AphA